MSSHLPWCAYRIGLGEEGGGGGQEVVVEVLNSQTGSPVSGVHQLHREQAFRKKKDEISNLAPYIHVNGKTTCSKSHSFTRAKLEFQYEAAEPFKLFYRQ